MQPAEPMGSPPSTQDIPDHIPVDAALAPEQRPFEHTRKLRREDLAKEETGSRLAKHSLSPEQLGVVGYVKDVAGFVKDAVHEARERKNHQRQLSDEEAEQQRQKHHPAGATPIPRATQNQADDRMSSQSPSSASKSPLAEAVTGLFPGLDPHGSPSCTHADELRSELRHSTHQMESPDHKLLPED